MENVSYYFGADLSKNTIDLANHQTKSHLQIENSKSGFKQLLKWLRQQKIASSDIVIVMEHTGMYSLCFEEFLHHQKIIFCKVNALEIKRSLGLIRGKSDKIDASRIALYGFKWKDKLKLKEQSSKTIQSLKMLNTSRELLVKQRASLKCSVKEFRNAGLSDNELVIQSQLQVIKALDVQIEKLELKIQTEIKQDQCLAKNYELLTSIIGVGPVIASTALVITQNFTVFATGRKFACYSGTAPFEHTSGTSVRGKTRVSHLADKRMKSLLDVAAKSAILNDPEINRYYQKRVSEGKNPKSTRNIVRNKIIYRMFAVIKRQTPFVKDYLKAA